MVTIGSIRMRMPIRIMLLCVMIIGLLMSAVLPEAFRGARPRLCDLLREHQVGRTLFVLMMLGRGNGVDRETSGASLAGC